MPDGGESVPELVSALRTLATDPLSLLRLLESAGYRVQDGDRYERVRFVVHETLTYAVDDDFPRIVSSSFVHGELPGGVLDLTYRVELANEPPRPLAEAEARAVLDELAAVR